MLFWILFGLLGVWSTFTTFYLVRFAKIIMILEDDFSESVEVLQETEKSIDEVLHMPLFYDSPEVKEVVTKVFENIKLTKLSIAGMIRKFTQRSKQKYIQVKEYIE